MKHTTLSTSVLFALSLVLSSCCSSNMVTKQQRTYDKYVQQSSKARQKQRELMRPAKPEMPPTPEAGDFVETVQLESTEAGG